MARTVAKSKIALGLVFAFMFALTKIDYFNHRLNKIKERGHSHTNIQEKLIWYVIHFHKNGTIGLVIDVNKAPNALKSHQMYNCHTYSFIDLLIVYKQAILCQFKVIFNTKRPIESVSF